MANEDGSRAVLYIPGMVARRADVAAMLSDVGGALARTGINFHIVDRSFGAFSLATPDRFAREITESIRAWFAAHPESRDIVLAGHSFGGMFARRVWLDGLVSEDPLDRWAHRVRGFVLVGSPDRGVDIARLHWSLRLLANALYKFGVFQQTLLSEGTKGSKFVTDLRLNWIANREHDRPQPRVAHILGTTDGFIARSDCLDSKQFVAPRVIDLPDANHDLLARPRRYKDNELFVSAWEVAVNTVLGRLDSPLDIDRLGMSPKGIVLARRMEAMSRTEVRQSVASPISIVVFLLHGIRASNHEWPKKLAAIIKNRHPDWEIVMPSYGYFTAWRFAIPWLRSRPVAWFKDQYTTMLDQHRNAAFHFVGHSNGTYAFGRSVAQCRGIRFHRVCLAGTVLPTHYDLDGLKSQNRIGPVRVDCASADWPVGILCSFLSGLGMQDVGVAGVRGFDANHTVATTFRYHKGGHGRPLNDDHLPLIADFLDGTLTSPLKLEPGPAWWLGWPSRFLSHRAGAYSVLFLATAALIVPLYMWLGLLLTATVVGVGFVVVVVLFDTI